VLAQVPEAKPRTEDVSLDWETIIGEKACPAQHDL